MPIQVFAINVKADTLEQKKAQNEIAIKLLVDKLSELLSCKPSDLEFRVGTYGKPYLAGENKPFFNLSHSGDWIVLTVSDKEIGIDIEKFRKRDFRGIVKRFFHPMEKAYFETVSEEALRPIFISHWTYKEAYLKLIGVGIGNNALNKYPIVYSCNKGVEVPTHQGEKVYFQQCFIEENYKCSIAAYSKDKAELKILTTLQ